MRAPVVERAVGWVALATLGAVIMSAAFAPGSGVVTLVVQGGLVVLTVLLLLAGVRRFRRLRETR